VLRLGLRGKLLGRLGPLDDQREVGMGEPGIMEGGERKFGGLDIGEDPDDRVVSLKPRPWLNPVFIAFVFHGELLSRVSPAPPWSERIVAR
jgi:hypothetical protein